MISVVTASIRRTAFVAAVLTATVFSTSACVKGAPLAPSSGTWSFKGSVNTTATSPIAGALLTVVDGPSQGSQASTDSGGHFTFANLASGRFTVTITADGFQGASPVVDLYADVEANFALAIR
jgi:hypothetical protein